MVALGDSVKCRISGFTGIVTGLVDYLSGCRQALVAPPVDDKGSLRESQWLDVQRLVILHAGAIVLDNGPTPGFDKAPPTRVYG